MGFRRWHDASHRDHDRHLNLTPWVVGLGFVLAVGFVALDAQNPVSVAQIGTTPVTTTMPVSGTVTATQATGTNLHVVCDSGCAAGAPGQQNMANSSPVVIASNQSAIPVTGTFWQATQPVSGTFWQATQPVSGTFWQATQPVSGTVTTTPPANASTNVTQFGGTNVSTGTGAGGAGIPRVTISNDSTVGLVAGTAVIGHVIADTGSTTAVTGNVTVVQPTGTNLHAVLDTTSTTAVTQAAAANLNATVVGTGTFAAQVTGTVTANAGTNLNTSALALEAGGNLATVNTNTAPLVVAAAGGYVRQDSTGTIAKETGGNLATIATQTKVRGTASSPTMVMATNVDTTLLAANAARVGWQVCNRSASPLLVKFGSSAATNSFNVRVEPNSCFTETTYTGQVNGLWFIGADQYAMVSESS